MPNLAYPAVRIEILHGGFYKVGNALILVKQLIENIIDTPHCHAMKRYVHSLAKH